jgi:predicted DNA-binding protein with PD1-like motif
VKTTTSETSRHIVIRADAGEVLPDSLLAALRDNDVGAGWMRASGVLSEVDLRAFSAEAGGLGATRRIAGPVQVLSLEGSIGISRGEVTVGMRALLARETDRGMETLAGEIVSARIAGLEAIVTALDDVAIGRVLDASAGVWLLEADPSTRREPPPPRAPSGSPPSGGPFRPVIDASSDRVTVPPAIALGAWPAIPVAAAPSPAWGAAISASADVVKEKPPAPRPPAASPTGNVIPPKPVRAIITDDNLLFPEAGDVVEHFAFGRCEVLKSDGDRLQIKVGKDGRMREIALEMLRVTELESQSEQRRFKLDRKL